MALTSIFDTSFLQLALLEFSLISKSPMYNLTDTGKTLSEKTLFE